MKKVFLYSIGAILVIGLITLLKLDKQMDKKNKTLRVAFPAHKEITSYDPAKIHWSREYILLENIFSPLVELSSDKGAFALAIARKFYWQGNELHFEIRENLYTVDGYHITAKDVEFSLKRLLILAKNTHGNLKDLICRDKALRSISDVCTGMEVRGNKFILKPTRQTHFLLTMLTAIDFAIIPIPSVDKETLKIQDYRNTSGVYYVEKEDGKGNILLRANKKHFHFTEKIPTDIYLVPSYRHESYNDLGLFKKGKVDFITITNILNPEDILQFSKGNPHVELHVTQNIKTFFATYTNKGINRLKKEQRLEIGKVLKEVLLKHLKSSSAYKPTNQFFPAHGDGGLIKKEQDILRDIYKNTGKISKDLKIHLSTFTIPGFKGMDSFIQKAFPKMKITRGTKVPAFAEYTSSSEIPDIFICETDTGFMEDIGLITYAIKAGFFGYEKTEGQKWLKEYMQISDKEERLKKLRKLHFKVLSEGILIPLFSAPYVALARKPWKMKLPQMYANNPLWLIQKN